MALRHARLQGECELAGAAATAPGAQHGAEHVGLGGGGRETAEAEDVRIMTGRVAPACGPADYLGRNCCGGGAMRPLARSDNPRRTS